MLKQLLLLSLVLIGIQSACSPGCSKCIKEDSVDKCEICDLSRFYYLKDDGTCELKTHANCKIPSPSSTSKLCVQCHDNHFFDELVQACVSVPDSKKDENCSVYSLVADCLRCNQGYIVESGKCVVPSNNISNCLWQISEEHCQTCESGYQLNVARTTCLAFSTVNNCQLHQNIYCDRCQSDYTLAFNWDLLSRMTLSHLQESLTGDLSLAVALDVVKEDCVKKDIENCVTYDSYGRCDLCQQSYHVDPNTGKCALSREPEIFKCKVYTNVGTCGECDYGFYLDSNKCVERNLIEHCLVYTVNANSCDECAQGYYSAGSSCQLRNASANINHCTVYKKKEDKCETCESPFVLSTDFIKCFKPIKYCVELVNALSTDVLSCTTCKIETIPQVNANGLTIACDMRDNSGCVGWSADNSNECTLCLKDFYWLNPSSKLCTLYSKQCKTYAVDSDNCASCFADQYLDNADINNITCKNYTVKNCATFEPNSNACDTCVTNVTYKDTVKSECHPYTLMNCNDPKPDKNECNSCASGFYLADSLTCLPEDLLECTTKSNNICTVCNPGFYLFEGKCYPGTQNGCLPANYIQNQNQCNTCESGFYLTGGNCHPYTVSNCQGSSNNGYNTTSDECTGCLPGFYLATGNKCLIIKIPNCNKANTAGTTCTECAVGFYVSVNACFAQYVPFCKDYTVAVNECTTCKDGYYRFDATTCSKNEILNCKSHTSNANTCETCENGFEPSNDKSQCLKVDDPGCQTYVDGICTVPLTNFYISSGVVLPKMIPYCLVPETGATSGKCLTCFDGYNKVDNPGGNTNQCVKPTIAGCQTYADNGKCLVCQNGFFTDDSGTTCEALTANNNCLEFSKVLDGCVLCKDGFVSDGSNGCTSTGYTLNTLNCRGTSAATTLNDHCTSCPVGSLKIPLAGAFYAKNEMGVYSKKLDGNFNQLAPGYEFNTYIQVANPDSVCLQLKSGVTGSSILIDSATNCAKCRNTNTHFLTGGTCTARTTNKLCGVYNETADTCLACQPGLAYNATPATNNDCTEPLISTTTNCKNTASGALGCYICDDGFVVDTNAANVCVSNALKNCRTFSSADAAVCTECLEGSILDKVTNTCRRTDTCFVGTYHDSDPFCSHCFAGFKPVTNNKYYCEPAIAEDICALYANSSLDDSFSYCVKCKQNGTVPVNEVSGGNVTFKCVKSLYSFLDNVGIVKNATVYSYVPAYPEMENGLSKLTNMTIEGSTTVSHLCQSMDVPNCDTYDFTANFMAPCSKCKIGYYSVSNTKNGQACLKGGIAGCKEYTSRNDCALCESKWTLDSTNSSEKFCKPYDNIPFCEIHSGTSAACLKCASGYLLRNSECFVGNHVNCKYYDFKLDNCFGCEPGYYIKDGTCRAYTQTNCLEYDQTEDYCTVCAEDFYLYKGACNFNTSLNCQRKSRVDNNCLDCKDGHYMDSNAKCHPFMTPNCLIYDRESPNCLNCQPEYYLHQGFCNPYSVKNCLRRDSEMDRCEFCQEGFFLNSLGFCEQYTLKNCAVMNPNANQCHQCKPGFYLVGSSVCEVHTVRNCSVFNDFSNECLSCLPGNYKNSVNDCVKYTNTKNCALVDPSQDSCITCNAGYYMDFGVCQQYTVRNCNLYKSDANLCVTCNTGYFLLLNTCEPYTIRCEQYNPVSNTCITCPEGYYLDDGLCYVNNGLFCKEISPFRNGCKSCVDGFYLQDGQCKIRMKSNNCKEVVETGDICLSCFKTHYLAAGFCISRARDTCKDFNEQKDLCTECETGKYWMSHNLCEEYTVENCDVFSPTSDKCTQCKLGKHYLDSVNGVCLDSTEVEKCKMYSNINDACTHCEDGFYLVSGSECRRNPTGLFKCIQYKDENTCIKCETGFFVDNNYCQKSKVTIENCVNYFEEGKCDECASTHFILENACLEKVETSCLTWQDSENCLTCQPNFFLKTNENSKKVCVDSELPHCVKAEEGSPTNKCLQCTDKKLLVNDSCQDPVSPLTGCKVYVTEGECSECDDGYTLTKNRNGCVSNHSLMSPHCAYSVEKNDPVCRSCMSGYHLDENRECVSCGGNGCNVCDPYDSTKCLFCNTGFNHDGQSCTQIVTRDTGLKTNRLSNSILGIKGLLWLFLGFSMIVIR